jgi:hypothetical protein
MEERADQQDSELEESERVFVYLIDGDCLTFSHVEEVAIEGDRLVIKSGGRIARLPLASIDRCTHNSSEPFPC